MSSNICGNCANFKPEPGQNIFNCTSAKLAGIKYGMQVRADTRACDAFAVFKPSSAPKQPIKPASSDISKAKPVPAAKAPLKTSQVPADGPVRPRGLCAWGKTILAISILVVISLLSWGIYACTSSTSSPGGNSNPTPTPGPTATPLPSVVEYFDLGQWASTSNERRVVISAVRVSSYATGSYISAPAIFAPPGLVFIIIDTSTLYTGNSTLTTSPADYILQDSQGFQYRYTVLQNSGTYPTVTLTTINNAAGGQVLFVVPDSTSGMQVSSLLQGAQPVQAVWSLPW